MEIILTDLNCHEFFENGGIVELNDGNTINNRNAFNDLTKDDDTDIRLNELIKDCRIGYKHYEYDVNEYTFNYIDMKKFLHKKDAYGIKNVNFSCIGPDDKRWEEFTKQRLERGFDSSELWNLDSTIISFILPRIKAFYNNGNIGGYPAQFSSEEEWANLLRQMVEAFELANKDHYNLTDEEWDRLNNGLDLFRKYLFNLWD